MPLASDQRTQVFGEVTFLGIMVLVLFMFSLVGKNQIMHFHNT